MSQVIFIMCSIFIFTTADFFLKVTTPKARGSKMKVGYELKIVPKQKEGGKKKSNIWDYYVIQNKSKAKSWGTFTLGEKNVFV